MGKKLGVVAVVLGAFVLALAALSKFYMYDRLAVVPFNQASTSTSETAPGADAEYLDIAAGAVVVTGPLRSVRITTGDVDLSKEASDELGRDVAVWDTYVCTDTPTFDCASGETPLSADHDLVAFDRNTAEVVDWSGATSETDGESNPGTFEGLYFKFPFDTQKKTYDFWDGTLGKAVPAEYIGTDEIEGLKVYEFRQTIEPTVTGTADVPGTLVGETASTVTAERVYSNVRTLFVEPVTGAIIKGGEDQDSYLAVDGERRATTTKGALAYTDDYVQENVDDFTSKAALLNAVQNTIPLGGLIVGVVLIVVGVLLRRDKPESGSVGHRAAPLAKVE